MGRMTEGVAQRGWSGWHKPEGLYKGLGPEILGQRDWD